MPSKKKRYTFTFNGKRYSVFASSAGEAASRMAKKQKELEEGVRIAGGSMPFRTWATQYLEVYKTSLKPDSYQSYVRVVNQLCKQIGDLPLKSIAPLDCQRAINAISGKSKSYIRNLRRSLKEIMQCAVDNKKIKENPAESVVMPTGYRGTRRALTSEERERVLQLAVTNRRYYAYLLMMLCGCRPAEASEVKRDDISDVTGMAWAEAKASTMTDEEKIATLEAKGFKRWTKYGKDRLYINAEKLLNLEIHYRKSGSISFSEMDGESISHGEAYRLIGSKIWIDLQDNFSKHISADEYEAEEIIAPALDRLVEGIA